MNAGAGLLPRRVLGLLSGSILLRITQQLLDVLLVAGAAWVVTGAVSGASLPLGVLAALLGLGVGKAVARYGEQYLGHHVAFRLLATMRVAMFEAMRPLVPAAVTDLSRGDLGDRVMADVDRVEVFYAHTVAPVVSALIVPTSVVIGVALWVDPLIGMVLAAGFLLAGVVAPALGHRLGSAAASRAAERTGAAAAHLVDGVQGLAEVIGYGYGSRRLAELEWRSGGAAAAESESARYDGVRAFLFDLIAGLTLVGAGWASWVRLVAGEVGLSPLAAALAVSLIGFVPLRDVQGVKRSYDRAMAAANRLRQVADRLPVVAEPDTPQIPERVAAIVFDQVGFAYEGSEPVLEEVDLAVARGRRIAVVGASGSGKTTLARLAVRFWDVDRGEIRIGGVPIDRLPLESLRRLVAIVPQQPRLVFGTIAENIALGRPAANLAEIEEVARIAGIHDFVVGLPDGYDTGVGEMGDSLSGGQRQRIAIARALLSPAPILILDEATSDLDVDTEEQLMSNLERVLVDRAVLIIAHRISTVAGADEIVVLDRGRVAERGTHAQLLDDPGSFYSRLWDRQLDRLP